MDKKNVSSSLATYMIKVLSKNACYLVLFVCAFGNRSLL